MGIVIAHPQPPSPSLRPREPTMEPTIQPPQAEPPCLPQRPSTHLSSLSTATIRGYSIPQPQPQSIILLGFWRRKRRMVGKRRRKNNLRPNRGAKARGSGRCARRSAWIRLRNVFGSSWLSALGFGLRTSRFFEVPAREWGQRAAVSLYGDSVLGCDGGWNFLVFGGVSIACCADCLCL